MDERLWTKRDLARFTQQPLYKIDRDVRERRIPHIRLSRYGIRFRPEDIRAYLEAHAVQPEVQS